MLISVSDFSDTKYYNRCSDDVTVFHEIVA